MQKLITKSAYDIDISKRFDIYPKLVFARFYDLDLKTNLHYDIYHNHTKAMNNFVEFDNEFKKTYSDFISTFLNILDIYKKEGIVANPIKTKNLSLINGSHRLASALQYYGNVNITSDDADNLEGRYLWPYHKNQELNEKSGNMLLHFDSDYVGLQEFIKYVKNAKVLVVTPNAENKKLVEHFLSVKHIEKIIYKKSLKLTKQGYLNLNNQLYGLETWANKEMLTKHTDYCTNKVQADSEGFYDVDVYLLNIDLPTALDLKNQIRLLFYKETDPGFKNACHICDTYEETISLTRSLFKNNADWILNKMKFINYEEILSMKKIIHDQFYGFDKDDLLAVSGSTALNLFFDTEPQDIDLVFASNLPYKSIIEKMSSSQVDAGSVNYYGSEYLNYFQVSSFDELLFLPKNYFWMYGIKFLMPQTLNTFYASRYGDKKEKKDKIKTNLLYSFFNS